MYQAFQPILNINHKIALNNIIIFFKSFGEKGLVKSVKLLQSSIKLINSTQIYPQITDSYTCILKILYFLLYNNIILYNMFLFPKKFCFLLKCVQIQNCQNE